MEQQQRKEEPPETMPWGYSVGDNVENDTEEEPPSFLGATHIQSVLERCLKSINEWARTSLCSCTAVESVFATATWHEQKENNCE